VQNKRYTYNVRIVSKQNTDCVKLILKKKEEVRIFKQ